MVIKRSAIQRDSDKTYFYLPPFVPFKFTPVAESQIELEKNKITGKYKQIINRQTGYSISISGMFIGASIEDGLLWQQAFRDFLRPTNGNADLYHVVDWTDNTGIIKRFFNNCYLAKDVSFENVFRERVKSFSLGFTTNEIQPSATAPDSTIPSEGPYELFVPDGSGSGSSSGGSGSGTIIIVNHAGLDTVHVVFPDKITSTTNANNWASRQAKYKPDVNKSVVIKAVCVSGGGALDGSKTSGQTAIKISTVDFNTSGGTSATISVPYNSTYSDPVSCNITIPASSYIYVYVTEASGGHSDLQVSIAVERS